MLERQLRARGEGGWLGFLLHSKCSLGETAVGKVGRRVGGRCSSLSRLPGWVFLSFLVSEVTPFPSSPE